MVHARHLSSGIFSLGVGLILLNVDFLIARYFALFYIFIGIILFFNSFRKRYAYSN